MTTASTTAADPQASTTPAQTGQGQTVGTIAESRPVGVDDCAVIAVFNDLEECTAGYCGAADDGFPIDRISIIGKDLQSEFRVNPGFVTMVNIARPSAATGAWIGGPVRPPSGTALLFMPGAGPLHRARFAASAAVGAAEGRSSAGRSAPCSGSTFCWPGEKPAVSISVCSSRPRKRPSWPRRRTTLQSTNEPSRCTPLRISLDVAPTADDNQHL